VFALVVKSSALLRSVDNLLKTIKENTRLSSARIGSFVELVNSEINAVSHTENTNSKKKLLRIPNTRPNHANNTSRLAIALMDKDANIFIKKLFNPIYYSILLRKSLKIPAKFMKSFMKSIG